MSAIRRAVRALVSLFIQPEADHRPDDLGISARLIRRHLGSRR